MSRKSQPFDYWIDVPPHDQLSAAEREEEQRTGQYPVRISYSVPANEVGRAIDGAAALRRPEPPRPVREFMTPAEYAEYRGRGVTPDKVRFWANLPANPLPVDRLGPRLLQVRVEEADQWISAGGPEWAVRCRAAAAASREAR
jgi:hypothetical protein